MSAWSSVLGNIWRERGREREERGRDGREGREGGERKRGKGGKREEEGGHI